MANDISELRLFSAIVEAGSLSESAKRMNISVAAISRSLAALERRLNVRLLTRTSRRFELTAEGALLHGHAVDILRALDEAEAEVSAKSDAPRGLLCVGAPSELGRKKIAPLIEQFSARFPTMEVRLVLSDIGFDVIDDQLDVALRIGLPTADTGVVARKLMESRRVVCVAPSYARLHGVPQTPEALQDHDCLRLVRGHRVFDRWRFQRDGAFVDIDVKGRLSTASGEVLHDWALAGRGVALKALWDIEQDLQSGALIACLAAYNCDLIDLYAVYVRQRYPSPRLRVFLDFLQQAFGASYLSEQHATT